MTHLSPEQAIDRECSWCMNNHADKCRNRECPLHDGGATPLKRILDYCLRCVPEQDMNGVKKCTGEILNPEFHICSLHPFRLGRTMR